MQSGFAAFATSVYPCTFSGKTVSGIAPLGAPAAAAAGAADVADAVTDGAGAAVTAGSRSEGRVRYATPPTAASSTAAAGSTSQRPGRRRAAGG
ncbi:hypothetical protein CG736_13540 [Kitasatospora sp. CB02891]|nr:hypothetical protein CG736_13540 [Kitasatospora sp. CB02891]